jgi:hypothetical protein
MILVPRLAIEHEVLICQSSGVGDVLSRYTSHTTPIV